MNRSIIVVLVSISSLVYGQGVPLKVKADSVEWTGDSTYLIVYKGVKTGLYDLSSKKYVLKPAKQLIVDVPEKEKYIIISQKNQFIQTYGFSVGDNTEENNTSDLNLFPLSQNRLVVTNFNSPSWRYGETDIPIMDNGYSRSGVLNTSDLRWLIPPQYVSVQKFNSYFFCLREDSLRFETESEMSSFNVPLIKSVLSYDVYEDRENQVTKIASCVHSVDDINLSDLLGVDSANALYYNLISTFQKKGHGLAVFDLFHKAEGDNRQQKNYPEMIIRELLPPVYDLVILCSYSNGVIAFSDTAVHPITFLRFQGTHDITTIKQLKKELAFHFMDGFIRDYVYDDSISSSTDSYYPEMDLGEFRIKKLNDSLVLVIDFVESRSWAADNFIDPGGEGRFENLFYENNSGIYNIRSGQWELPREFRYIYLTRSGYLVDRSSFDEETGYFVSDYTLLDKNKNKLLENLTLDDVLNNKQIMREFLFSYDVDTIFDAPNGSSDPSSHSGHYHYFRTTEGKIGLLNKITDYYDKLFDIIEPKTFVHNQPNANFTFYVNDDSLCLLLPDKTERCISATNGRIDLNMNASDNPECCRYEVQLISGNDSTKFVNSVDLADDCFQNTVTASILIDGDIMVVQDLDITEYYYYSDDFTDEFYSKRETENASVWKRTTTGWEKISPYYAGVCPVPNGFIARTAYLEGEPVMAEYGYFNYVNNKVVTKNGTESRYILLDEDAKPVSFVDYYDFDKIEDLGFGLKICTNNGCMFVTYDRKPLTNDEWANFVLENGRIKAIYPDTTKTWGKFRMQEEDLKVQYFDLPKK